MLNVRTSIAKHYLEDTGDGLCPYCRSDLKDDASVCPSCGARYVQASKFYLINPNSYKALLIGFLLSAATSYLAYLIHETNLYALIAVCAVSAYLWFFTLTLAVSIYKSINRPNLPSLVWIKGTK